MAGSADIDVARGVPRGTGGRVRDVSLRRLFAAAVAALAATACRTPDGPRANVGDGGPKGDGSVAAASPSADLLALDGPALYTKLCAACHGDDAKGYRADNAPSLVNPTYLESATDLQIHTSIAQGRPGTAMAAYGKDLGGPLDAAAIGRIVTHLRSQGPKSHDLPPSRPGDATKGKATYATSCQGCHGTPTARGNAVHLANTRFLEVSSDAFLRWAVVQGRPGTPMLAFGSKLNDAEIDDVVAYVRTLDKPPPVVLLPPPTGKEPVVINPGGAAPSFTPRADPCGPDPQKCTPDPRYVSVADVSRALAEKRRMVIIDARSPSDWMRVHIPGAVSIPHYDLKRLSEIPNDGTWVIAYCACPHHLSGDVVNELRKRGYKKAVVLDEGILEWHRRGYPVVAAEGVEKPPPGPGGPAPK